MPWLLLYNEEVEALFWSNVARGQQLKPLTSSVWTRSNLPDGDWASEVSLQCQHGRNRPAEQPYSLPVSSSAKWTVFPSVLKWAYVSFHQIFFKSEPQFISVFLAVISLERAFENVLSLLLLFFHKTCANKPSVFHQNWVHLMRFLTKIINTKKKKDILMNHFMVVFVKWMFLFLF